MAENLGLEQKPEADIGKSFMKRGRPFSEENKDKDRVRQELAKVRATAMEGSFGTQKEHYDLKRVKALQNSLKSYITSSASTQRTWCSWRKG